MVITSVTDSQTARGTIRTELDSIVAASPGAWTREDTVWNSTLGYPGAATLHGQRLYLGGSSSYPQTVWGSGIGRYLDFELGTDDDDAMSFTISSDQINPIVHLAQIKALMALTYGGEFTLLGGVEKPITPTNIQIKSSDVRGCNSVRPVRVGSELLFVQRSNRRVFSVTYDPDSYTAYAATDISVLSEHITAGGLTDAAYQQDPDSLVWFVRGDGLLLSLTLDRAQDVICWTRHTTDGLFESVASIPGKNGDEVYAVVAREVNGATVRYVERLENGLNTDAATTGTSDDGADTWAGLAHLEGKTVDIVADGAVQEKQVVTDGQITLSRPAHAVEIGLHYDSTIVTLTPEVSTGEGTAQGTAMSISKITLRFLETTGATLNGDVVAFRQFGDDILDAPAPLFTGDHVMEVIGWDNAELTIQQTQPLPFHLLAVITTFTTNGG